MMTTTHIALGLSLAYGLAALLPDYTTLVLGVAVVASIFPDFDVVFEHRKTLHYPVYFGVAALPLAVLVILAPSQLVVGLFTFLAFAWVHSISDIFGGGAEAHPWEGPSTRAVFLHPADRWIPPTRGVRYDGSPEDLALCILFSIPAFVVATGALFYLLIVNIALSVVYTAIRKQVPDFFPA
ncbi:metal-dependent hydrolase [Haladaptatus sp. GCM10025707]|uniref:metal-dependent hydrolase n=1 Tax=unclassified Haladaptatus TaxID=2622732 RepID=UPI0023E858D0|nr:metal-dependent hydrolase [Haladaptatus sp. QDMS2]